MGGLSLWHMLLFGGVAILVLGGGRFSSMMGDVAKGIKQFKKGMADDDEPARIEAKSAAEPAVPKSSERVRDGER